MANKRQQLEIFRCRFKKHMWDLDSGNHTSDHIHAQLVKDCKELLATPPEGEK